MSHPKAWTMDQYIAGELEGSELSSVRAHLTNCSACSQYIKALEHEQEQFLQQLSPSEFAQRIQHRAVALSRTRTSWRRWMWWLVPACAAAAMVVFFTRSVPNEPIAFSGKSNLPDDVRWMGFSGVSVRLVVQRNGDTIELEQAPIAGDRLQVELTAKDQTRKHFVAVYAYEDGSVHQVLPATESAQPFEFQGNAWLPGSVLLDVHKPGTELFIIVRTTSYNTSNVATDIRKQLVLGNRRPLSVEGLVYHTPVEMR